MKFDYRVDKRTEELPIVVKKKSSTLFVKICRKCNHKVKKCDWCRIPFVKSSTVICEARTCFIMHYHKRCSQSLILLRKNEKKEKISMVNEQSEQSE